MNTGLNNYIHGGEFVVLTNPSVTNDSRKLVLAQARYLNLAPLTMTDEQMEKGLEIFEASLKEALEA